MNRQARAPGGCSTQREGRPGKLLAAEPPPWTTAANCWRAAWGPSRPRSRPEQPGWAVQEGRCRVTAAQPQRAQTAPTHPSSSPNGSTAAAPHPAAAWTTATCGPPSARARAPTPALWVGVCPPSLLDRRMTITCLRTHCWGDTLPAAWPPPSPRPSWRSWIWSTASLWWLSSREGPVPVQPHQHLPLHCPPPPRCCLVAPASPPFISCSHPASHRPPPTPGPRPPSLSVDQAAKSRQPSATPSSTPCPAPPPAVAAISAPTCLPAWRRFSPPTPPLPVMSWWPKWIPSCPILEGWAWWAWARPWWAWGPNPISCCWVKDWSWTQWPPWRCRPRCSHSSITSITSSSSSSRSTSSNNRHNSTSITLRWGWGWSSQVCLRTHHSSLRSKPITPRCQLWALITGCPSPQPILAWACRGWVSSELRPVSRPVRTGCPQTWTWTCSPRTWIVTWTTSSTVTSWTETASTSTLTQYCPEAKATLALPPHRAQLTAGCRAKSSADLQSARYTLLTQTHSNLFIFKFFHKLFSLSLFFIAKLWKKRSSEVFHGPKKPQKKDYQKN